MSQIGACIVFENAICNESDPCCGQNLYELINFDDSRGDKHTVYVDVLPRVGETVELSGQRGCFYFTVLAVHHQIQPRISPFIFLCLRQIDRKQIPSIRY